MWTECVTIGSTEFNSALMNEAVRQVFGLYYKNCDVGGAWGTSKRNMRETIILNVQQCILVDSRKVNLLEILLFCCIVANK